MTHTAPAIPWYRTLSPQTGRWLALLLLALSVLGMLAASGWAVGRYRASAAWMVEARQQLILDQATLRSRAAVDEALASARASPWWSRRIIATDAASAETQLLNEVRGWLLSAGATVDAVQPVATRAKPVMRDRALTAPLPSVEVVVQWSGTMAQLTGFLQRVDADPRSLRVAYLRVTAPALQSSQENPRLDIDLRVAAYFGSLPPADPAANAPVGPAAPVEAKEAPVRIAQRDWR